MSDQRTEGADPSRAAGVPRDAEETRTLLESRPAGWEYLLFAGRLDQGKQALRLAWRDHQLELPRGPYRRLEAEQVPGFLSGEIGRLGWIIGPLQRVFDSQEDAFGKPGEPGDAVLIEHFADWIISTYRQLMEWAADVRSVGVPDEFEAAVRLWAHAADTCVEEIGAFIDDVVLQFNAAAEELAGAPVEEDAKPITLTLTLTLTADDALNDKALALMRDAIAQTGE